MPANLPIIAGVAVIAIIIGLQLFKTIPLGQVGVASLLGDVIKTPSPEVHVPVNPLYRWQIYDAWPRSIP